MSDDKSASPEEVMKELEQTGRSRKSRRQLEEEKAAAAAVTPVEDDDVDLETLVFEKPEGERPEKPAPQQANPLGELLKTGNRRGVAVKLEGNVGDSARQYHRGQGTKRVDW